MKAAEQDPAITSALHLYHTAYRCQYEENDIREACRLYREIIRQFPDSNEAAYAVVQLEKIGAKEAIKMLKETPFQKLVTLAALLVSLFALFIAGTALLLVLDKNENSWYNDKGSSSSLYCFALCKDQELK